MRYENVQLDFWSDPDFENESFEVKALYVYYLTSPHANLTGIYKIGDKSVLAETNISSLKKLRRLKERLQSLNKILFDKEHNLVWVVGKGKRLKGESQIAAAKKILKEDIPLCKLKDKFLRRYTHLTGSGQGVDTPPTGSRGGTKQQNERVSTGSHTVTVSVTNNIPRSGPKEIQNQKIGKIQDLFEERFGKKLSIKQVQVLVYGGGNGEIYGFCGKYEALGLAINDIPEDVADPVSYVFKVAGDGVSVEKYLKRTREKAKTAGSSVLDF
jgi:hypothetical protein